MRSSDASPRRTDARRPRATFRWRLPQAPSAGNLRESRSSRACQCALPPVTPTSACPKFALPGERAGREAPGCDPLSEARITSTSLTFLRAERSGPSVLPHPSRSGALALWRSGALASPAGRGKFGGSPCLAASCVRHGQDPTNLARRGSRLGPGRTTPRSPPQPRRTSRLRELQIVARTPVRASTSHPYERLPEVCFPGGERVGREAPGRGLPVSQGTL
jgi:hypothetical protein